MNENASVMLVLDSKSKSPEKSLKIRITYDRQPRQYATKTKIKLTQQQFQNPALKITKQAMREAQESLNIAQEICDQLGTDFSFEQFHQIYKLRAFGKGYKVSNGKDLDEVLNNYFAERDVKPTTMESYRAAVNWVHRFDSGATITSLTDRFIRDLKDFMDECQLKKAGKKMSQNSKGMYFRALRAICNFAIEKKYLSKSPFDSAPVSLQGVRRSKRAIALTDWRKFLDYCPERGSKEEFAQDFVRMDFSCNGANLVDILSLTNACVSNGQVSFIRQKTERFDQNVNFYITDDFKSFVEKYGRMDPLRPNDYILPFFSQYSTAKQRNEVKKEINKRINGGIKSICTKLQIPTFTTYQIRHTFASNAQSKMELAEISMALGHSSIKTTEWYLKSLDDPNKKVVSNYVEEMLHG